MDTLDPVVNESSEGEEEAAQSDTGNESINEDDNDERFARNMATLQGMYWYCACVCVLH